MARYVGEDFTVEGICVLCPCPHRSKLPPRTRASHQRLIRVQDPLAPLGARVQEQLASVQCRPDDGNDVLDGNTS